MTRKLISLLLALVMLCSVCVIGGVGLLISVFLSIFAKKFAVEVDEKEAAVLEALPGNNCGGCGYPGCSGLAAAIAKGVLRWLYWLWNLC